jgi:hypothetical protein
MAGELYTSGGIARSGPRYQIQNVVGPTRGEGEVDSLPVPRALDEVAWIEPDHPDVGEGPVDGHRPRDQELPGLGSVLLQHGGAWRYDRPDPPDAAEDLEVQLFTAPAVSPSTRRVWANQKRMIVGMTVSTVAAAT